jgi:hypothetical protein
VLGPNGRIPREMEVFRIVELGVEWNMHSLEMLLQDYRVNDDSSSRGASESPTSDLLPTCAVES